MRTHAPKYFFNTLHKENKKEISVQYKLKNGNWSKSFLAPTFGQTNEQVLIRLIENNKKEYRLAE